jgi:hypothetical protein
MEEGEATVYNIHRVIPYTWLYNIKDVPYSCKFMMPLLLNFQDVPPTSDKRGDPYSW